MTKTYASLYAASIADPDAFWLEAARAISWDRAPARGWTEGLGWFAGGSLNTCYNAVDRHVEAGRGDALALIYESPVTGQRHRFSFSDLQQHVARTAGMIAEAGVQKGDRVVIYMPMVPETVFAMLACARIGAIHSVVFGGFAAPELAKRIDDATPRLLLTASCGIEGTRVVAYKPLVDRALDLAEHKVDAVIVLQRPQLAAPLSEGRDLDWSTCFDAANNVGCVSVAAEDPLYILYTSGTTGTPKGIVRQNGGHAVALAWSMANIYGLQAGETFWAASDVGWVVGHSYIVYGPLIAGCTTVLFEGKPVGTPDAGTFWRSIAELDVDVFFTAPTALRAIRKEDPDGSFISAIGTGQLRALFLAGERADPETVRWAEAKLGLPVIDHWWQTELGWPAAATCLGLGDTSRVVGSAGRPVPGFRFAFVDDGGQTLPDGQSGHILIATPLPPGCYTGLWNDDGKFASAFSTFPGFYETGDGGTIDEDGFVHVMGRTDDIINVAGHRLSTGQIEGIVAGHPAVAECAVVGVDDPLKGAVPIAFVVAKAGVAPDASTPAEIVAIIRDQLGPVASMRQVYFIDALPKTRSGKILRSAIRRIAQGEKIDVPPTIENPDTLVGLESLFAG